MILWLKSDKTFPLMNLKSIGGEASVSSNIRTPFGETNQLQKPFVLVGHVSDPESGVPEELDELIERVEEQERIFKEHYTEGVYRHEGATLVASMCPRRLHNPKDPDMIVKVSGPSVEAVRTLYFLFRQGKVSPEEDWGPTSTDSDE